MNQQTLYIAFGGDQVAVHSSASKVLARLKRDFCHMIESKPTRTVGWFKAECRDGMYITGNSKGSAVDRKLGHTLECLSREVILDLIRARPDLLWLHAGAAVSRRCAVIVSGPGGCGKSTIVTHLCASGWRYLSDDIVPLAAHSGRAFPFPLSPAIREDPGRELPSESVSELIKTMVEITPQTVCREPVPIRALVFPVYCRQGRTELLPCSPATAALELLQNCLNFPSHHETAVRYVSDLVKIVSAFRLTHNDGRLAAELIAQLLDKVAAEFRPSIHLLKANR